MIAKELKDRLRINGTWDDYIDLEDLEKRRLFLCSEIVAAGSSDCGLDIGGGELIVAHLYG